MKLEFSRQIFEKYSNTKLHKTRPAGAEYHTDGRTDLQTDMTKVLVAFRNFTNATKNEEYL